MAVKEKTLESDNIVAVVGDDVVQLCPLTKTDYDMLVPLLKKRYKELYKDLYLEEASNG
tara:strand:+ start:308 stop:484 length:177 start_codon:yes stop_codon:yes gene_type:complete